MSIAIKIVGGLVGLAIAALAVMWIIGLGPFNTRPSAAAKAQPKIAAAVQTTQAQAGAAVAQVETTVKAANTATEKRTEGHVAKIRSVPRVSGAVGADFPDREFYLGVCSSQLYARSPDCRGYRGEPEGGRPAARARTVRGR